MLRFQSGLLEMSAGVLAALLAFQPVSAQSSRQPGHGLRIGEPFPAVSLPSLADGSLQSIAAFRGRKVILHVFASW